MILASVILFGSQIAGVPLATGMTATVTAGTSAAAMRVAVGSFGMEIKAGNPDKWVEEPVMVRKWGGYCLVRFILQPLGKK